MTTLEGDQVRIASMLSLRSFIALHLAVPHFDRRKVLAAARSHGFTGRTLAQARVWVDEYCDKHGIPRNAGLPAKYVRHNA